MSSISKEIKEMIDNWKKTEVIPNSRNYSISKSPIVNGEYMIVFEVIAKIGFEPRKELIRIRKRFFTFEQKDNLITSKGDIYNLKLLLDNIEVEFQAEIDKVVSGYLQKKQ